MPLHLIMTRKEPNTLTARVTVVIVLQSGVDQGGFPCISQDGLTLEIVVKWPTPFGNLDTMHKKWLNFLL